MDLENLLQQNFELFSKKLSGSVCQVKTEITNFLKLLSKQQDLKALDSWFAWYYVAFQFEYYSSLKTKMDGRYPANWIFGPKALKRWNERNEEFWMYHIQQFLNRVEIQQPVQFCSSDLEGQFEVERKRFFNTDAGLFHCLQFSRYSPQSPSCLICRNKRDCIKLWK